MSMFGAVRSLFGIGARRLLREAAEEAVQSASNIAEARAIILAAFSDALITMQGMVGNPGQDAVFQSYVLPQFSQSLSNSSIENGWQEVDIGEYMDFMGEIVGEGNFIMELAFEEAAAILDELEEMGFEGISIGNFPT